MADIFGNLDLFAEFEKDREATESFIHYDEDAVRSKIVFEDFADEQESESDDEFTTEDIKQEVATSETATGKNDEADVHMSEDTVSGDGDRGENLVGKDKSKREDSNSSTISESQGSVGEQSKVLTEKGSEKKSATSTNGAPELTAEDAARSTWLNEQLYAEAAEEARNISTSTQQLIYERNKYRRYAKILDSTRYVPDEDSPAVQLIFNNNSFARKYRQQIEQFIKSLLWEELNSASHDTVPEITVKPGVPTCIDINSKLPSEKRIERMRQKHAIIGNSQFHKQFLIDFLGWPFTVAEPTRCNVNWEIPLYGQVFNEVFADPTNKIKKTPFKKQKPACWNCGEDSHAVNECKHPRNPTKIAANRREFLAQQQERQGGFEPKFTGPSRYHLDQELGSEFFKFKPGVLSEALRQALGLTQSQLPQHIYKMRLYGYPPGWLAEARQIQSGVTIFDKNGRVTLITGECLEDGELEEEGAGKKAEYDVNKIIEYPGFTVPVPLGYVDEHSTFKMPPIQNHQLKKTLMTQTKEKTSSKKRKREKGQDDQAEIKKVKTESSGQEDGEIKEEGEVSETTAERENNTVEITEGSTDTATPTSVKTFPVLPRSSSTISLSRDFGTPVFEREKSGLPDASKFGQGIEEHIPFENLPNSVGTFEKMKGILDTIRNKFKK